LNYSLPLRFRSRSCALFLKEEKQAVFWKLASAFLLSKKEISSAETKRSFVKEEEKLEIPEIQIFFSSQQSGTFSWPNLE